MNYLHRLIEKCRTRKDSACLKKKTFGRDRPPLPAIHPPSATIENRRPDAYLQIARLVTETSVGKEQLKIGRAMAYLLSLELVQPLKSFGFTVQHATTRESPANITLAIENLFVEIV